MDKQTCPSEEPRGQRPIAIPPSTCPHCGAEVERVTGLEIYPDCPERHAEPFYRCAPCEAYIDCHAGTTIAKGTVANAELREARELAHGVFDLIWVRKHMSRNDAYAWLAKRMMLPFDDCHIGLFGLIECRVAYHTACWFFFEKGHSIPRKLRDKFE